MSSSNAATPHPNPPPQGGKAFKSLLRLLLIGLIPVLIFCAISFVWIDQPLALWFKENLIGTWSVVFHRLTDLGLGGVWLIPSAAGAIIFRWQQVRAKTDRAELNWRLGANGALFLFASVASSGLLVDLLKGLIGRLRPYELFEHQLYGFRPLSMDWAHTSFPSGHGQTAFAALTAFAVVFPRAKVPLLLLAVLIAATRVIISVHYLSDVVMGAYLGFAGAVLLAHQFIAHGWDLRQGDWSRTGKP